jgi:hypothetical protein
MKRTVPIISALIFLAFISFAIAEEIPDLKECESLVLRTSQGWWMRINKNGSGNYGYGTMIDRVEVKPEVFNFEQIYEDVRRAAEPGRYTDGHYTAVSFYMPDQSSAREYYLHDYIEPVFALFVIARANSLPPSNEFEERWHSHVADIWEKSPPVTLP